MKVNKDEIIALGLSFLILAILFLLGIWTLNN
jgi:cytochrome oxidase assembly protein ShyY1